MGGESDWKRLAERLAVRAEKELDRGLARLGRGGGGDRPARIVGYRSYGTRDMALVRGRVLLGTPPAPATAADPWWLNLSNAFRRIRSGEVPGARVRAHLHGVSAEATADEEGHFTAAVHIDPPLDTRDFWHDARVELLDHPGTGTTVPVGIPGNPAFGVISDLDDTVLQTDVRNIVRMGREVLFGNAHTRIPFPGVGAFYRALHDGGNPLFYVSSSPWNLYDVLSQFLHLHRIPAGSMDLRDWGIGPPSGGSGGGHHGGGHHGHKRAAIDRILATYPSLPFILVGDSGQEDPEIYRSVVHDHPERVLAIYIRSVVPHRARIDAVEMLGQELASQGIDLVLAQDTVDAARHAAARGWIPEAAVESVAVDRARERHDAES